ncbi:MAG: hypothetical protein GY845_28340 [Planctomycetes bacterium]|nr:hypothetical protein [Planctomycetota bacterium]
MSKEEKATLQDVLEMFRAYRRANETPEQAMDNFEKFMEDTINSDNEKRES